MYLIEVDIHALELKVGGAIVDARAVKAMLARDDLPVKLSVCIEVYCRVGFLRTRKQHRFGCPATMSAKSHRQWRSKESYTLAGLEMNLD